MTTIRVGDGWRYTLTDDDLLWLARMAHWEGGNDPADTIWTMAQAYAQPVKRRAYATFGAFLQAYSQPINPKWRRDGEFCRPGGRYYGRDECSAVRLDRRDHAAHMTWDEVDADVVEAVQAFADGRLPNPVPKAVEFANQPVSEGFLSRNEGSTVIKRAGNWFIATRSSLAWPHDWVTVDGMGSGRSSSWLVGVVAAAVTAAGVYFLLRR